MKLFAYFTRIRCRCTYCGGQWRIPRWRILRLEYLANVLKGQPCIWECHDCHEGVVIPDSYINIHGEKVTIDPQTIDPNTEVIHF